MKKRPSSPGYKIRTTLSTKSATATEANGAATDRTPQIGARFSTIPGTFASLPGEWCLFKPIVPSNPTRSCLFIGIVPIREKLVKFVSLFLSQLCIPLVFSQIFLPHRTLDVLGDPSQ